MATAWKRPAQKSRSHDRPPPQRPPSIQIDSLREWLSQERATLHKRQHRLQMVELMRPDDVLRAERFWLLLIPRLRMDTYLRHIEAIEDAHRVVPKAQRMISDIEDLVRQNEDLIDRAKTRAQELDAELGPLWAAPRSANPIDEEAAAEDTREPDEEAGDA